MDNKLTRQENQERERACSFLADELNKDRLVVFIGSGCSRAAGLPTWQELIDDLIDKNSIRSKEKDLITLASIIESKIGKENFREQIVEKLKTNPKEKSTLHEKIVSLGLNLHITTNYDHILENAFRLQGIDPYIITQGKDIPTINPTQKIIVKLHGDIDSPSSLILTSDDYREYNFIQKQFIEWLNAKFAEKTVLFLGTSFADPRLRRTEEHVFSLFKDLRRGHYIVLKKPDSNDDVEKEDFEFICTNFRAKGFHVLQIDSYDDVEKILDKVRTKSATQKQNGKALSGAAVLLRDDYANSLEKELKDHIDNEVLRLTEDVRGNDSPLIPTEKIKRAGKLLNYIEVNLVKLSDESKLEGYLVAADAFCDMKDNDISKSEEIFDKANAVFQKIAEKTKWEERLIRTRAKILFFEGKVEEAIASLSDYNEDKTMAFKLAILIVSNKIDKAYDLTKSKEIKIAWVSEALYTLVLVGQIDEAEALFAKIFKEFTKAKQEARLADSDFKNAYFSDKICYAMASGFLSRMFFVTGKKEGEFLTFADINKECIELSNKCLEYLDKFFDFTEAQSLNSHLRYRARLAEMTASELIGNLVRANKAAEELLQYKPINKDLIAYVMRRGKCWERQDIVSIAKRVLEDYPESFYGFFNAAMIELSLLSDKEKAWYLFKEAISYAATREDFKRLVLSAIGVGFNTGHLKEVVSAVADILPSDDIYKDFLFAEYADCEGDAAAEIKYAEIETKNPPADILATVKFRLALIAQKKSELNKAKTLLEESNKLFFSLQTLQCLLHVLTLLQDDSSALKIAEQVESLDPTDLGVLYIKAQTARNLGFYKKSQDTFSTLVEKFPEKPEYAYGLAHVLMLQFKYAEGLDVLKKFISEDGFFNVNCLQLAVNIYATRNKINDLVAAFNLLDKFYDKIINNYNMLLMHMDFAYRTDNDVKASRSIQRMKELKAEGKVPDNVFREVPFEDLKRIISETHEAKEKSNSDYLQGKLPRLLLSEERNTPAYLDWAFRTQELVLSNDPKLWVDFTVYATNGLGVLPITPSLNKFIPIVASNNDEIIIDLQALITIHRLGLLDELGERYKKVYYPANLLKILKYQEDKFHFPQKSRENVLRKLAKRLDVGTIRTAKAPINDNVLSGSERDLALANDEQIPLIDSYIEDTEHFPDVAIFGAAKLAEWLFERGKIDEERYKEFIRISADKSKMAGSHSFKDVLESKYRILVGEHTIELMEDYELVDNLLSLGLQICIEEYTARAIKHSVREIDFQGEVGGWQRDLIDALTRYTFFEEASYQSKRKDSHELLVDVISSPIEFANERKIFLLTDDRFCQQVALQENFYNRFGSDALLKELYDKKIIDIDQYTQSFLQLCNWRYRFLLPDVDVLLFLAQKYKNNPPGQPLKTVTSYFSRCMEDPGLFLGFEKTEPPMPLGVKYYMELSGIWIEFLAELWKEESVTEDCKNKFSSWVLLEAYPVPPRSLNYEIRKGLILAQKRAVILRLFTNLIGGEESYKYKKLLDMAFKSLHFKDEERIDALLDFLEFSKTDKYEDEVKQIIAIKALELFCGDKADKIQIDDPRVSAKLSDLGFPLTSGRDLSLEEEEQILQDIDGKLSFQRKTTEYKTNLPVGPLIPSEKRENEITILSVHDLISAPSSIVRQKTIDFLLRADFLLDSTKVLIKDITSKILDNESLIWSAAASELKTALLHDIKYTCQFFKQTLILGQCDLSRIAWKSALNPKIESVLEEVPWYFQQNNLDPEEILNEIKKQFAGLNSIEDILNKVFSAIYFLPFGGKLSPWNIVKDTSPFLELDREKRKQVFYQIKEWIKEHNDPFAYLITLDLILNIRRLGDTSETLFNEQLFYEFLDELLEPLLLTDKVSFSKMSTRLLDVVWQMRRSLAQYYLQYIDLECEPGLDEDQAVVVAWWISQKVSSAIIESIPTKNANERISWIEEKAHRRLKKKVDEITLLHFLKAPKKKMSKLRYHTLKGSLPLPTAVLSLLMPPESQEQIKNSTYYGIVYPTKALSPNFIKYFIDSIRKYVLTGEGQLNSENSDRLPFLWNVSFGIAVSKFLHEYYGAGFKYLGKDNANAVNRAELVSSPNFLSEHLAELPRCLEAKSDLDLTVFFSAIKTYILINGKMPESADILKNNLNLVDENMPFVTLNLIEIFKLLQVSREDKWLREFEKLFKNVDYKNISNEHISLIFLSLTELVLLGQNFLILDELLNRAKTERFLREKFGEIKSSLLDIRKLIPLEFLENMNALLERMDFIPVRATEGEKK